MKVLVVLAGGVLGAVFAVTALAFWTCYTYHGDAFGLALFTMAYGSFAAIGGLVVGGTVALVLVNTLRRNALRSLACCAAVGMHGHREGIRLYEAPSGGPGFKSRYGGRCGGREELQNLPASGWRLVYVR